MMQIEINKLVRSKRRTIALIVERDGSLTVRAPKRAAVMDIHAFILEKQDWIVRTQERMKSVLAAPKKEYKNGEVFLFLGNRYELTLVKSQRPALKFEDGFTLGNTAQVRGERFFVQWYKEQALSVISERVRILSIQHGFSPKQVKISSARTRWGSCSSDGTLNFTWRLIMAPLDVVDYVVVHELVHLRVKNHSSRFWKEVGKFMPDYKVHRKWLRIHGEELSL
ncbi:MAG: SprT family zinc-dependent metalloprotease [Anaerolineales bacterium]